MPRRRPRPSEAVEGGVETIETTPPLELRCTPEDSARQVARHAGRAPVLLLVRAAGSRPVAGRPRPALGAGRRAARARRRCAIPLALVAGQAREERGLAHRARRRSAARVEAGQRLAGSALDRGSYVALLLELALRSTRTEAGFVAIVGARGSARDSRGVGAPGRLRRVDRPRPRATGCSTGRSAAAAR